MKIKLIFIILILCILFSGCAVMNTSILETAETVKPGHPKIGYELCKALDLTSTVFLKGDSSGTFTNHKLLGLPVEGIKFGFGIMNNLELNAKLWYTISGTGLKFYLKYRVNDNTNKLIMAILPGFSFVNSETDKEGDDSKIFNISDWFPKVKTIGGELPIVISYQTSKVLILYGAARYSVDYIETQFPSGSLLSNLSDNYILHRFGIIAGLSLKLGYLYLRPEAGLECAKQINGDFGILPVFGGGIGFEF